MFHNLSFKSFFPSRDTPIKIGSEHSPLSALSIHDLTVAYHHKPVVWDVDLDVPEGSLVGIVGPNGAGKSTLIKAILELIPKASGHILLFGKPYHENQKRVAYVPQRESVDWDFPVSVLDIVTMGRYGKIGWIRPVRRKDRDAAFQALETLGISSLAHRQINQLSGGQQQRTFLARALVQDADIYLMDEPFAAVDAATEKAIVQILQKLREKKKTCLVVHHDLQTVTEYFDRVILMNMRVVAYGKTKDIFTQENLHKTYGGKLTLLSQAADAVFQTSQKL